MNGAEVFGIPCAGGPLALDNIQGNTIQDGIPAYNIPVEVQSVASPLKLHISGKNLIDFSKATKTDTMYGISYTISDDGVIALSGTANRGSAVYVTPFVKAGMVNGFVLPAGNYHLSGLSKDYLDNSMRIYFNSYTPDGSQQIGTGITADKSGISFSLSSSLMITLNIRIEDGVNVDGVTITPQIEVGSQATDYQTPSNTAVEIPLLGTDGQILEPLREVSGKLTGESGAAYPFLDRIVRHGGVWAVERNVREYDLSEASWTKNTDYMYPYIGDYAIKSGTISNYVKCTHFPARGDASSQSAGAWLGTFFVIGNDVLPNGADTTVEKMKTYCQTQDSNGTPVKVCVPIDPPVYEELHQDVQVILNTLCVPGGTCSVWFEGDILPSGADIGLPRGDYPCSGVEGAYRWLAELSSPLSAPTQDDLYAWALSQQRGGVFATNGSRVTKNVPEAGDLTGLLAVTEQGTAVSMIVFGPTGKIYTSNRVAGVWRGWSALYSSLNPPDSAGVGDK